MFWTTSLWWSYVISLRVVKWKVEDRKWLHGRIEISTHELRIVRLFRFSDSDIVIR